MLTTIFRTAPYTDDPAGASPSVASSDGKDDDDEWRPLVSGDKESQEYLNTPRKKRTYKKARRVQDPPSAQGLGKILESLNITNEQLKDDLESRSIPYWPDRVPKSGYEDNGHVEVPDGTNSRQNQRYLSASYV